MEKDVMHVPQDTCGLMTIVRECLQMPRVSVAQQIDMILDAAPTGRAAMLALQDIITPMMIAYVHGVMHSASVKPAVVLIPDAVLMERGAMHVRLDIPILTMIVYVHGVMHNVSVRDAQGLPVAEEIAVLAPHGLATVTALLVLDVKFTMTAVIRGRRVIRRVNAATDMILGVEQMVGVAMPVRQAGFTQTTVAA